MPQNYSLGGKYVSKEKYEEAHGISKKKEVPVVKVAKEQPKTVFTKNKGK